MVGVTDSSSLQAINVDLEYIGVVDDLSGDLVATFGSISEATSCGDFKVTACTEIVQVCSIPLNYYSFSSTNGLESLIPQILCMDIETYTSEC
jgi:hypothetical protein